jgi:hypothetical protein
MSGMAYGLGRFDDVRLQKGGPIYTRRWSDGLAAVFASWRNATGRAKYSSRAFCATRQ